MIEIHLMTAEHTYWGKNSYISLLWTKNVGFCFSTEKIYENE